MWTRRKATAIVTMALVVVALLATGASSGTAATTGEATSASGLPTVSSGARPGPDVLYAAAPDAPQLENRSSQFRAQPLLVSGTEAYVDGEYLYQDHLYDDYGADTDGSGGGPLSEAAGDIDYPTDRGRFGGNAADLVELRISTRSADAVSYRFTLNTLLEPDTTIATIAFDTDGDPATGASTLPRDPGATFAGIDEVITTWGTGAEHTRLGTAPVTTAVEVTTELDANQLTVVVPRSLSDPDGTWRAVVAVGLHDPATGGWLRPGAEATDDQPGGAALTDPDPSGIFNLGFRFDEPVLAENTPPDTAQATALAAKDAMAFARDIDFTALAERTDRSTVPSTGTQVRIFPSRLDLGEGRDLSQFPSYLGPLQPYSVYVPTAHDGETPLGLTLDLHSLGQNHWQYNGSEGVQQIGEGRDAIVLTPHARGPDGWYQHEAEYDVFEAWNDLARHVPLDPDRTAVSGYSMGGYGTYRLGGLYPDLFGRAFSVVGPPGEGIWLPPSPPSGGIETLSNLWLESTRNVPFLNVVASSDELVPIPGPVAQNLGAADLGIQGFEQLGYRYRFVIYTPAEHFTLAILGYDIPIAPGFLGEARVDRNPTHVTFAYLPVSDDPDFGLVHDHAYWVSDVQLADASPAGATPAKAVVDAFSHARGQGDPPSAPGVDAGTEPLPYNEINRSWGEPPAIPAENELTLALTNVGGTTLDTARAGLDPAATLTVATDASHDGELRLTGAFPSATAVTEDGAPVAGATVTGDGVTFPVQAGARTYVIGVVTADGGTPDGRTPGAGPATGPITATGATGSEGAGGDGPTRGALARTGQADGLLAGGLLLAVVLIARRFLVLCRDFRA